MGFPQNVQDRALVASGRCCCICHKFCGTKINLHHIIQQADGGDNSFDNCIPLCLDCHEDMDKPDPRHATGKRYSVSELKMHRDNWYASIKSGLVNAHGPVCEEDKTLFTKIRNIFTADVQGVIKNYDFRESFPSYLITALCDLHYLEESPENEFVDSELEMLRGTLFASANKFRRYLAEDTFAHRVGGYDHHVPNLWLFEKGYINPIHVLIHFQTMVWNTTSPKTTWIRSAGIATTQKQKGLTIVRMIYGTNTKNLFSKEEESCYGKNSAIT